MYENFVVNMIFLFPSHYITTILFSELFEILPVLVLYINARIKYLPTRNVRRQSPIITLYIVRAKYTDEFIRTQYNNIILFRL